MKPNWKTLFLLTTCCTLGLMTSVRAQVSPDGTLSTTVNSPDNLNFTINNGNRVGGNLFHSFREFSVPNGGSAVFQNPLDVQNIINRVTGGSLSQINGLIQTQGSANLFLLNPAGIFFGPNARLNIGGSFFATTADSFLFENGLEFSATNPQAPLLTVNIPIGLRFRDNPGNITNQSPLIPQVPPGQTLALIGGDVNFDGGSLTALGVNVEIGGLKAPGTVVINNDRSLSFPDQVTRGDISFRNGASVDVSFIGGGSIALNGRNVEVSGGSRLDAGIFPGFGMSEAQAGDITINATDKVTITGTANSGSTVIANTVGSEAAGNAGKVIINTGSLEGSGNFVIGSSTFGQGNAGTVSITAKDNVSLEGLEEFGSGVGSLVGSSAMGNGADIIINARSLSLSNFAQLATSTLGQGRAGNIQVNGSESISVNTNSILQANSFTDGQNAGNIDLRATEGSIVINQASIGSSAQNTGFAGDITLNARDQVSIDRSTIESTGEEGRIFIGQSINNAPPVVPSSININNSTVSTTNSGTTFAGDIALNARDQVSLNQSTIESNGNFGLIFIGKNDTYGDRTSSPRVVKLEGSSLSTTNQSITGADDTPFNSGNISIDAIDSISLNNQSFIQALTRHRGNAGNVTLRAENGDISLAGGSNIFSTVESGGTGNAGKIDVTTRNLSLTDGSELQTLVRAGQRGNAGNITVQASGNVSFSGFTNIDRAGNSGLFPSGIFNEVESGGSGNAGNILINAASIFLDNGALLRTTNASDGFAGDIALNARDQISLDRRSIIESNGNRGRIFIGKNDTYGDGISSPKVVSLNNTSVLSTRNGNIIEAPDRQINSGNVSVDAQDSIFLGNGSEITAATDRRGNGGDVTIRSGNSVTLSGVAPTVLQDGTAGGFSSGLFTNAEEGSIGRGGQIFVQTPNLRVLDGAVISARSRSGANAGNIRVNSRNVDLRGGGQILVTAVRGGNAGNVDVTANRITISGTDPTYFARFNQVAQFGRDIAEQRIDPVAPESGIFVNSTGTGQGGNLSIQGNTLTLDRGIISASTASADGGNINLSLRNFLRLQNESLISANAGGQQNGGNAGNITINTPFIVAFPRNNDIIANAVSGSGGRVRTNATLFGIVPRTRADLARLGVPGLNPRNLSTSDITAFSEQNSNFGDNVLVTSPDVDPSRGLVELPETVTDPTQKIAQNPCQQGVGNEFFVTGRGGLPTTPNQTLSSDNVRVDLLQPVASSGNSRSATIIKPATNPTATRVPAQGWIFNDKGQVVLTAYDPTNTGSQRPFSTAACPAR
ncbi:filamentous hemagglutinin family outer membrane protein [Tolypothrix sp. NIES-4075]|uniref:two-partner secretion domain-containing protein n=1 Tax=Tolypothrix sp. NIES-4075 TaxID=2005459 RepID=UPI000B5CC54D|nr:filamentous hemagglutinin N-terminal domain-containing protein [Tolypothrix sp. NIES-4075]GAX42643.1 filamentous hemagglutinin family outer membrane protein [Tolypothrix sp. NIES-4075]